MFCAPAASFVVRRTFLDVQLDGESEQLPLPRPRANTDTRIDYSFTDAMEARCGKDDSMDDISDDVSARATTAADDISVAATDVSDRLSWASEMEQEEDSKAIDVPETEVAPWVASLGPFQAVAPAMEAMPMLCQQATFFMMVPMAPAVLPTEAVCDAAPDADTMESERARTTTLVLRKLPKDMSNIQLRRMLDSADFESAYDFIYVPINFKSGRSLGYALVNFIDYEHALTAQECFHGARMGRAAIVAELSCKHSGLSSLIEQYQSSHVLTDETLPNEHKPQLLRDGKVMPFPIAVPAAESADEC